MGLPLAGAPEPGLHPPRGRGRAFADCLNGIDIEGWPWGERR